MTKADKVRIKEFITAISNGIDEYAETLETTDTIRCPLDELLDFIEKLETED